MIISCKHKLESRLDMSPITPDCAQSTESELGKTQLQYGAERVSLGDMFALSKQEKDKMIIRNSSDKMDYLGSATQRGSLFIEGDAGHYLGRFMQGGQIHVSGSAGAYLACAMDNGFISVGGNVGDYAAASPAGLFYGMRGGTLLIKGGAGCRLAERMRRGTIMVQGAIGDYCAARMVAGTVVAMSSLGKNPAFMMKRGTLLAKQSHAEIDETFFSDCGYHEFGFLTLLFNYLSELSGQTLKINHYARRWVGDRSVDGRGEILLI